MENLFEHEKPNKEPEADYITYGELAEKVGTMVLCEKWINAIEIL